MEYITDDLEVQASLVHDEDTDWQTFSAAIRQWYSASEVVEYLEEDPRHAVFLFGGRDRHFGEIHFQNPLFILRGAGEGLVDFFYGELPAEDPNDAEGPYTAEQALGYACGEEMR